MLRWSAESSNTDVDLQVVNGAPSENSNVELANELADFAAAVASGDETALAESREKLLVAANADILVSAAGVAANFQRMVRIADSIGIPADSDRLPMMREIVDALELSRFKSAENTPL